MDDYVTFEEYRKEVRDMALEAIYDIVPTYPLDGTQDDLLMRIDEYLWEYVESHKFIVRSQHNFDVLKHSRHDESALETFGAEKLIHDGTICFDKMAFVALFEDAMDEVRDIFRKELEFFDEHEVKDMLVAFVREQRRKNGASEEEVAEVDDSDEEVKKYFEELTEKPLNECEQQLGEKIRVFYVSYRP